MSEVEKMEDPDDSSSGEDVENIDQLLNDIILSKVEPVVKSEVDARFEKIDDELKLIDVGIQQLHSFNGKVDSCLARTKFTLDKWIFPHSMLKNDDVCVIDLPSGVVPKPKFLNNVATKKVTNRFAHGKPRSASNTAGEVIPVKKVLPTSHKLPPIGATVIKPPLHRGMKVHCMATTFKGMWYPGCILDILDKTTDNESQYRVKLERKHKMYRTVSGKNLAYMLRPNVILPVGTRVIADYKEEPNLQTTSIKKRNISALYVGVIAEPPKSMNNYMYLIFFDDGYAQYCLMEEVFLVCESSKNVWEDIHPDTSNFIKEYLTQYPERPMVKLLRGQSVRTEWNGSWWNARVVAVHGSLAKMFFEADKRTEWVYRGSTRLGPLFDKLNRNNEQPSRVRRQGLASRVHSQRMPYVEYTYSRDEKPLQDDSEESESSSTTVSSTQSRNVARKSSSKAATNPVVESEGTHVKSSGSVEKVFVDMPTLPKYTLHRKCNPSCLKDSADDKERFKGTNPLEIPTYCGWRREIVKDRPGQKKLVFYVAPCGRRLRNIEETNRYLMFTSSKLTIDLFCFDSFVQTFQNYIPGTILMQIRDISFGKESVPVSCVNTLNREKPRYVEYSNRRIPSKDVKLNLDEEFLACCDCTDNCQDKSKCSCQQLTVEATKLAAHGEMDPNAGYVNKRLEEQLFTGLYECNERCKCDYRCMNRVVQNGLQNRLQLFKTCSKGWGLRTLDDLQKGSFICIYTGQLLTEQEANIDGTKYGDEYMAELDYIEVVENQHKEGYESDLPDSEDDYEVPSGNQSGESEAGSSDSESTSNPKANETEKIDLRQSDLTIDDELPDLGKTTPISRISVRPLSPESEEKLRSYKTARRPRIDTRHQNDETDSDPKDSGESPDDDAKPASFPSMKHSMNQNFISQPDTSAQESNLEESSVRLYFGEEYCYVMDAKSSGNIGRYLNHSCSPNVFVQNVFVDTHDLRFPWVAFFANQVIKAGKELCWDYNYEVGSVKGREIYCQCRSSKCRGRLL